MDFAGDAAVHSVGGWAALAGALILGPRIGKYDKTGKPQAIPGHNMSLAVIGLFVLWLGWFGFNPRLHHELQHPADVMHILVTTNTAAIAAVLTSTVTSWLVVGKPDLGMTVNGCLAGLVGITGSCAYVSIESSLLIGAIAGVLVVFAVGFFDRLHVDDPVGATAVQPVLRRVRHAVRRPVRAGGRHHAFHPQRPVLWRRLWAAGRAGVGRAGRGRVCLCDKRPCLAGGSSTPSASASAGRKSSPGWTSASTATWLTPTLPPPCRVEDLGAEALPAAAPAAPAAVPVQQAVPVEHRAAPGALTKLSIVTNQARFAQLQKALEELGVTGMTVTNVFGYGVQKGHEATFRGLPIEARLLPKLKVEVVVADIPVDAVLDGVRKALYTGSIGDGKIFVYDVENAVKIRTGEQGREALQGAE